MISAKPIKSALLALTVYAVCFSHSPAAPAASIGFGKDFRSIAFGICGPTGQPGDFLGQRIASINLEFAQSNPSGARHNDCRLHIGNAWWPKNLFEDYLLAAKIGTIVSFGAITGPGFGVRVDLTLSHAQTGIGIGAYATQIFGRRTHETNNRTTGDYGIAIRYNL